MHAHLVGSGFQWGEAWTRAAIINGGKYKGQFVSAGFCLNEDKKQAITSEVTWDLTQKYKGFQGMPLLWNLSKQYQYSNNARFNFKWHFGKEWNSVTKWETPVVDGAKITYHCQLDAYKALFSPKDL